MAYDGASVQPGAASVGPRASRGVRAADGAAAATPWVAAALALATFLVARPVLGLFFAQDDFVLIEQARWSPWRAVTAFFAHAPGMFRPVSRGVFFVAADRVLGSNAAAYHGVLFLVHLGVAGLVARLALRLGASRAGALGAAAWTALAATALHALAWVACIQQLLGVLFALLAAGFALDVLEGSGARAAAGALAAWLLAAGSVEQAAPVAALVAAAAPVVALRTNDGRTRRRARRVAATAGALFAAWAAWMVLWRSPPGEGPYAPAFEARVLALNAWVFLGRAFGFAARPGDVVTVAGPVAWPSHAVAVALVAWNLARGRRALVALALGWIAAVALPVLPLREHQMVYHAVLATPASALLAGAAFDDVLSAVERRRGAEAARAVLGVGLVVGVAFAAHTWRAVAEARFRGHPEWPRNFVVRRATIARNAWRDLRRIVPPGAPRPRRVVLAAGVVRRAGRGAWHRLNVRRALGEGAAVRLALDAPDVDVVFVADVPSPSPGTLVLVHDDVGHLRRVR